MINTCKQCNTGFETPYPDKVYCSPRCKDTSRRRRQGASQRSFRSWETGKRFNRLTLVCFSRPSGSRQLYICDCDCGTNGREYRADKLKDGRTQSCGCLAREQEERLVKSRQDRLSALLKKRDELSAEEFKSVRTPLDLKAREAHFGSIQRKHDSVKGLLTGFVSTTDPLWSLSYYAALIQDNECHYCRGLLDLEGPSLDTKESEAFLFEAYNVVPSCMACATRRNVRGDILSFEESESLGLALEFIRLSRKKTKDLEILG